MNKHKKRRLTFIKVVSIAYPIFLLVYLTTYFQFANWSEFAVYDMHAHNIYPFESIKEGFEQYGFLYIDLLVNILLFIPVGFLACVDKSRPSIIAAVGLGMLLSFGVELLQYMLGTGILNIDDLLLNFVGVLIGAIIYHLIKSFQKVVVKQPNKRTVNTQNAQNGNSASTTENSASNNTDPNVITSTKANNTAPSGTANMYIPNGNTANMPNPNNGAQQINHNNQARANGSNVSMFPGTNNTARANAQPQANAPQIAPQQAAQRANTPSQQTTPRVNTAPQASSVQTSAVPTQRAQQNLNVAGKAAGIAAMGSAAIAASPLAAQAQTAPNSISKAADDILSTSSQSNEACQVSEKKRLRIIDKVKWEKTNNIVSIITTVMLPFILFFILAVALTGGNYTFSFWHPLPIIAYFVAIYFSLLRDFSVKHLVTYFSVVVLFSAFFFVVML